MTSVRLLDLDLEVRTDRLVLRPLGLSDVDALWPFVSDPELPRFMTWEAHTSREQTAAFAAWAEDARAHDADLVWTIREGEALAGTIGLHGIQRIMRAWRLDRAELGYWVGGSFQGRGIATEAASAVVRFGFETLRLHKVNVGHVAENAASQRVIEKLGFRLVGTQRDHFHRYGRWWDHLAWELTEPEWRSRLAAPPARP